MSRVPTASPHPAMTLGAIPYKRAENARFSISLLLASGIIINMCLVYMAYCQRCHSLLRNYKRWPRFCGLDCCKRFYTSSTWRSAIPCHKTTTTTTTTTVTDTAAPGQTDDTAAAAAATTTTDCCTPQTCGLVDTRIKVTCSSCYYYNKRAKPLGGGGGVSRLPEA